MDREELLIKLTRLDFARFDLRLYLNTHPSDRKAIMDYNILTAEADGLRAEFDRLFAPMSHRDASPDDCFDWIDNPWPWDRDFIQDACQMDNVGCATLESLGGSANDYSDSHGREKQDSCGCGKRDESVFGKCAGMCGKDENSANSKGSGKHCENTGLRSKHYEGISICGKRDGSCRAADRQGKGDR